MRNLRHELCAARCCMLPPGSPLLLDQELCAANAAFLPVLPSRVAPGSESRLLARYSHVRAAPHCARCLATFAHLERKHIGRRAVVKLDNRPASARLDINQRIFVVQTRMPLLRRATRGRKSSLCMRLFARTLHVTASSASSLRGIQAVAHELDSLEIGHRAEIQRSAISSNSSSAGTRHGSGVGSTATASDAPFSK